MRTCARSRRSFLCTAVAGTSAALVGLRAVPETGAGPKLHLATNQYPWGTFYGREKRAFSHKAALAEIAACGLDGYEPLVNGPEDIDLLAPLLKKHGLAMRSFYVNSTLHEPDKIATSSGQILTIALKAKEVGARIVVTNPSPINWGGPENKSDAQLKAQAGALNALGAKLSLMGMSLAYHNHDIELRNAAREFHHMMVGTNPKVVTLCLDAHWIFRGAGDSSVALFDVLALYGPRVTELHLRQSQKGVWTEAFGEGDIDYGALAAHLKKIGVAPHLVLEQAVEAASPKTLDAAGAHRQGAGAARRVFTPFAK